MSVLLMFGNKKTSEQSELCSDVDDRNSIDA